MRIDDDDDERPACFVCLAADGKLHRVCRCASGYAHEECFEALVRRVPAHARACPVCGHEYAHARHVDVRHSLLLLLHCAGFTLWFLFALSNAASMGTVRTYHVAGLLLVVSCVWMPLYLSALQLKLLLAQLRERAVLSAAAQRP